MTIHAEGGKCWAYGSFSEELLAAARKEFYGDHDNLSKESLALFSAVERCISNAGDDVDGLFDLLDQVSAYQSPQGWLFTSSNMLQQSILTVDASSSITACSHTSIKEANDH